MKTKKQLLGAILLIVLLAIHAHAMAAGKRAVTIPPGEMDLARRARVVDAREKELNAKEEQLQELQKEIESRFERLDVLQKEVEAQLAALQKEEDGRLKNLVKVYSSMKASKVAPILDQMEDEAVVGILRAMKTEMVAQIMPKLDQGKAVRISKQLGMIE